MKDPHGKHTVMIVDDVPENLSLLEGFLKRSGYRVLAFPKAMLAYTAALKNPPDLFILDINMPEVSGYELCSMLKNEESTKEIPVIFISALSETFDKVMAFKVGGVDYMTKPFQYEELSVRVGTHISIRELQLQLQHKYDELHSLELLRDDLVHMVVHDMKSPIFGIKGYADLLKMQLYDKMNDEEKYFIDVIEDASEELLSMSLVLLDLRKLEEGHMPMDIVSRDIASLVADTHESLGMFAVKGKNVDISGCAISACVECDADLIKRVLLNLLTNALKFTPDGGTVFVKCDDLGDTVAIRVVDQGPGIPPEEQAMVFDRFVSLNKAVRKISASTGLGLTFCKLAVEAHGGHIDLESEEGHGCVFSVILDKKSSVLSAED